MNDKNTHDDDEDIEDDSDLEPEEIIVYSLDPQTHDLIEIACNCLVTLSEAQISEESAANLIAIADSLAERFNIGRLAQEIHQTDDGDEEIIFKPTEALFPEEPDEEGEAPAAKA
jgi:hypothetical protein